MTNARLADRNRQREYREQRKRSGAEPVSQTGLWAQAVEAIGEIVEKVRQAQRLSQAGLDRQVRRVVLGELRRLDLSSSVET